MPHIDMVRAGFGDDAVPYEQAWETQRRLHAARAADEAPDTVLLLEHPPVYTAGRRTQPWERPVDGTPVVDVDRGGRITWHGPGQLVGYPVLRLPIPVDVVAYVRRLEDALIAACAELGLETHRVADRTGVWFAADPSTGRPERKVAAIGVRVARGITMHGFSLNCDNELASYDSIVACGIEDAGVTTLSAELGRRVRVTDVVPLVERHLEAVLAPTLAVSRPEPAVVVAEPA